MTDTEVIWEHEGWVLALEDFRAVTDSYVYRLTPPKWAVRFEVAHNGVPGGETLEVGAIASRTERDLVGLILQDPCVKAVVEGRLAQAEWEGYIGSKKEDRDREPYKFKHRDW